MTLRVTVEIIPHGREDKARTIDVLNISNVTWSENYGPDGKDTYVIERNDYKNYTKETPRCHHNRNLGALALVATAINSLGYGA